MKKKERKRKLDLIKYIFSILIIVIITFFIISSSFFSDATNTYVVANGSLSYEENAEGYIIRKEYLLSGEDYENGMVKIVSDGKRVAKNEAVFRYYSDGEEDLINQISELDEQINQEIENNNLPLVSSDISSIDAQIENEIDEIYKVNYLQDIQDYKTNIDTYISKKAELTGLLSPQDSYVRELINRRTALENELSNISETIYSPQAGTLSYRIDGLEEVLKTDDFSYLNKELLDSFELKVGAVVPLSNEKAKVVDNFECYIATFMETEKAMSAQVGDNVKLRFGRSDEVNATIEYINEEDNGRIIVFKIKKGIEYLLEYRKISFDIVWWNYSGWKISNSALIEIDDLQYVEIKRAGYVDRILVKVLRQNETYSIVENYEEEELLELGFTEEEIEDMQIIKLYDMILLH